MVLISPSLMCMNLLAFKKQITFLNQAVDMYHIDIMDGHYVKNMTLSPWFIEQLNKVSTLPLDAHLMVTNPEDYIEDLLALNTKVISLHAEMFMGKAFRIIDQIKAADKQAGVVLNPETPLSTIQDYLHKIDIVTVMTVDPGFAGQKFIEESLEKVKQLKEIRESQQLTFKIQIDGSCNKNTFKILTEAGADILIVGGSGLFNLDPEIQQAFLQMQQDLAAAGISYKKP